MRWKTLIAILALASPVAAQMPQPTSRDTAFAKKFHDEANRKNGPRKSAVNALADSLAMPSAPTPPPLPAAPAATFTVACDTMFKCNFDGTKSTGYKIAYLWDCGAFPNCSPATTQPAFSFIYPNEGQRTAKLTVRDSIGRQSLDSSVFVVPAKAKPDSIIPVPPPIDTVMGIVPPALPRSVPDANPKPCTVHKDVLAGADLQAVVNASQPGDCLDLAPGAKWKANLKLPVRSCSAGSAWTTIQTKGVTDAPGVRITPTDAANFAEITQTNNQYAIAAGMPTCNWQLVHLNISRDTAYTGLVYHLLQLGASTGEGNTGLATQPHDIIVRRSWIHGTPTGELVRCIAANGINLAIVDSWLDDCHASGFDSQAIAGWTGAGPVLIQNNFLAGAGENVMFGGADPADSTVRPSDITILRNHFYKDLAWKGKWSIKNGFELKNARRVLMDGNVWNPCAWASSQVGMCIVIKSSTGGMASTVPSGTTDLTFTNNKTNLSNRGFNVQGQDCTAQACGAVSIFVNRVIVQNNLFDGIGTANGMNGQAWMNPMSNGPKNVLVRNNTFITNLPGQGKATFVSNGPGEWQNIRWRNNIFGGQADYVLGADCAQPTHAAALDCLLGAANYTFAGNVVSGLLQTYWTKNPPGNTYKVTMAELGFQPNGAAPSFPGVGADITQLEQKTAGVEAPATVLAARSAARARIRSANRAPRYTSADMAWCRRNACTIYPDR